MKFVTLRVWHPGCWMLDLSERHRDVCVESRGASCRGDHVHANAAVHAPDARTLESVLASRLPEDVRREVLHTDGGDAEVYARYPAARSISMARASSGFLVVGTIRHEGGYEWWQVLADQETLEAGLAATREVGEVKVVRVSDSPAAAPVRPDIVARLGDDLSPRQLEILHRAVAEGYYSWPRGKNMKRLAAELGISTPTCLEHIRRAESRIVPRIVNELLKGQRPPDA